MVILLREDMDEFNRNIFQEETQCIFTPFPPFSVFNISHSALITCSGDSLFIFSSSFSFFLFFGLVEGKLVRVDCWKVH